MKRLLPLALLLSALPVSATTFFVRADGGTNTQCTGTANAPYLGSGTNQACAFNHPYQMLNSSGAWANLQPGDTVRFDNGTYYMGEQNEGVGTDWHWQLYPICPAPNAGGGQGASCRLPILPNNTTWIGTGVHNSAHNQLVNPTVLIGLMGIFSIFDVQGTNGVTISGFQITQADTCVGGGSSGVPSGACSYSSNTVWGGGFVFEFGSTAQGPSNLTLHDDAVIGLGTNGVLGSHVNRLNTDVSSFTDLYLIGNGNAGWNADGGGCGTGCESVGTQNFSYVDIEWNGCVAVKPYTSTVGGNGFNYCYGQNTGGYGDGFVLIAMNGTVNIDHSVFKYNTQDGLDALHISDDPAVSPIVNVSTSWSQGNAGQQFKEGVGASASAINNVAIANCHVLAASNPGDVAALASYNNPVGWVPLDYADTCRAEGDQWTFAMNNGSHLVIENNTTTGYGTTTFNIGCNAGGHFPTCFSTGGATVIFRNNLTRGYPDPGNANRQASGLYYGEADPFANAGSVLDHNLWNAMFQNLCPQDQTYETNAVCADPLLTGESNVNAINPNPAQGSPAIGAGVAVDGPANDYYGVSRPNPPSIGAVEPAGTPTAATPTFSPVAGTYIGTQSVTISTSTGGATLCYTIDGTTPTANGAGTCTHGTTYSTAVSVASSLTLKAIASESGFLDSAVGSAAYTINPPPTPNVTLINMTISGQTKIGQ